MNTFHKLSNIPINIFPSDACVAFDVHVLPDGENHLMSLLRQLTGGRDDKRLCRVDGQVQLKWQRVKLTTNAKLSRCSEA